MTIERDETTKVKIAVIQGLLAAALGAAKRIGVVVRLEPPCYCSDGYRISDCDDLEVREAWEDELESPPAPVAPIVSVKPLACINSDGEEYDSPFGATGAKYGEGCDDAMGRMEDEIITACVNSGGIAVEQQWWWVSDCTNNME